MIVRFPAYGTYLEYRMLRAALGSTTNTDTGVQTALSVHALSLHIPRKRELNFACEAFVDAFADAFGFLFDV